MWNGGRGEFGKREDSYSRPAPSRCCARSDSARAWTGKAIRMTVRPSPGKAGRVLHRHQQFTGKRMMAYGQTAITEDLYAACDAAGGEVMDEADMSACT